MSKNKTITKSEYFEYLKKEFNMSKDLFDEILSEAAETGTIEYFSSFFVGPSDSL